MSGMIPTPGRYSLTVDNCPVLDGAGDWREFATLDDARYAARMLCGASIARWSRTDSADGRTSVIVDRVPAPALVPLIRLDLTVAPGRYLVWERLDAFRAACDARGLRVSVGYNYSGPSIMQGAEDGHRSYELREFTDGGPSWFVVRQRTA